MVRGRCQGTVRALTQKGANGMKLNSLVLNVVQGGYAGRAGIVVVVLPADHLAVLAHRTADVDHSCRPKVGPGKFLFARPHYFNGPLGCFSETGSLDSGFARVLSPITRTRIGHQDANSFFRHVESFGKLTPDSKWSLCAGPHGQIVASPLSKRSPRFQRSMRNVVNRITLSQAMVGGFERFIYRACLMPEWRLQRPT